MIMRIRCPVFATDIGAVGKHEIAFGRTRFGIVCNAIAILVAANIFTFLVACD